MATAAPPKLTYAETELPPTARRRYPLEQILTDPDFQDSGPELQQEIIRRQVPAFGGAEPEQQQSFLGALGRFLQAGAARHLGVSEEEAKKWGKFDMEGLSPGQQLQLFTGTLDAVTEGKTKSWAEAQALARRQSSRTLREMYVTGLGTLGEMGGRAVGGPPGGIVGATIGTTAGELTAPQALGAMGAVPPESVGWWDALKTGLLTGASTAALEGILGSAKQAVTPQPVAGAKELMTAFRKTAVTPKPTDVAKSSRLAQFWRGMSQNPVGQARIVDMDNQQAFELNNFADNLIAEAGPAADRVRLGQGTKDEILRVRQVTSDQENRLWDTVGKLAGNKTVRIDELKQAARRLATHEQTQLPHLRDQGLIEVANQIEKAPSHVTWAQADAWRKRIGAEAGRPVLLAQTPQAERKALFSAIMGDMERTTARYEQMQAPFAAARAYSRQLRELFVDSDLSKILDTPPEQIAELLSLKSGPTFVRNARTAILDLAPGESGQRLWRQFQAKMLDDLVGPGMRTAPGGRFEPVIAGKALERQVKRIGQDTLNELLTPEQQQNLKYIIDVGKALEAGARASATRGTSMTPAINAFNALFHGLPTMAGAFVGGTQGPGSAALGSAAGAVGSYVGARGLTAFLTSPTMARLIARDEGRLLKSIRVAGAGSREVVQTLGRWATVRASEEQQFEEERRRRGGGVPSPSSAVGNVIERMPAAEEPAMR